MQKNSDNYKDIVQIMTDFNVISELGAKNNLCGKISYSMNINAIATTSYSTITNESSSSVLDELLSKARHLEEKLLSSMQTYREVVCQDKCSDGLSKDIQYRESRFNDNAKKYLELYQQLLLVNPSDEKENIRVQDFFRETYTHIRDECQWNNSAIWKVKSEYRLPIWRNELAGWSLIMSSWAFTVSMQKFYQSIIGSDEKIYDFITGFALFGVAKLASQPFVAAIHREFFKNRNKNNEEKLRLLNNVSYNGQTDPLHIHLARLRNNNRCKDGVEAKGHNEETKTIKNNAKYYFEIKNIGTGNIGDHKSFIKNQLKTISGQYAANVPISYNIALYAYKKFYSEAVILMPGLESALEMVINRALNSAAVGRLECNNDDRLKAMQDFLATLKVNVASLNSNTAIVEGNATNQINAKIEFLHWDKIHSILQVHKKDFERYIHDKEIGEDWIQKILNIVISVAMLGVYIDRYDKFLNHRDLVGTAILTIISAIMINALHDTKNMHYWSFKDIERLRQNYKIEFEGKMDDFYNHFDAIYQNRKS